MFQTTPNFQRFAGRWHSALIRYPKLRLQGSRLANPHLTNYHGVSARQMRAGFAAVLSPIVGNGKVDVMLEQGCGQGRHITPVLKSFAREVWGVDLMPPEEVINCDRYICADMAATENHLAAFPSASVDVVMIVNYTGMHPTSTFDQVLGPHNDRLMPYLHPSNFPRVLKPNGWLVFVEWEAKPEERVGTRTAAEVNAEFDTLYRPPEIEGYSRVGQGFEPRLYSPYLIYRRR